MTKEIKAILKDRFDGQATKRSIEYQEGYAHALEHYLKNISRLVPYNTGTASCDAYLAGWDEGKSKAKASLEDE